MLTVVTTLLLMCPWPEMAEFFEVKEWDFGNMEINYFRIYILLIPAIHMVVAIAIEVSLCIDDFYNLSGIMLSGFLHSSSFKHNFLFYYSFDIAFPFYVWTH